MKLEKTAYFVVAMIAALALYSCANIGRPEGGPRDLVPPVYVNSNPAPNQLNYKGEKVEIEFNEYIQLKDHMKKVVVSPAQKSMPIIRSLGRKVTVELRDTLLPNTTYCIDFADCIQDNNEGNPIDGFSIAFSTGDTIDSLQVSGMMLRARDLEPMQSVIVGLQENLADSAFSKLPLSRIARTNEYGQFTIRNLKPGRYHVFGLNDMDGNYTYSRNEDMAFFGDVVVPSSYQRETTDTIFKYNGEIDTIQPGVHTVFTPNDIFLAMFNEEYRSIYMKKNERIAEDKLHILFSGAVDSLPSLRVLKPTPSRSDWYRLQRTAENDSLIYWLTDSNMIKSDSILVEARYLRTDTLDNLTFTTDTLKFNMRHSKMKKDKKDGDDGKKDNKKKDKKKKKGGLLGALAGAEAGETNGTPNAEGDDDEGGAKPKSRFDSIPPISVTFASGVDYGKPLPVTFGTPIDSISQAGVHLYQKDDTLWNAVERTVRLERIDTVDIMAYKIEYPFEAGKQYRVEIDSMSVFDCFGNMNKPEKVDFAIPSLEEYSNLYLKVNVQDSAFVELLNGSDKVVDTATVVNGTAAFENIKPGNYYARLVIDANGNGKWDTGNYAEHRQPEEVFYYPKRFNLKKNWDVEQNWNIYELAVDKQKPNDIKKNKAKSDMKNKQKRSGEDEDEEDEDGENWGVSGLGNERNTGGFNGIRQMGGSQGMTQISR
ncbi:MAG: Ig-like domain-containing protein [Muribaculaceae bacterium]